ncbi:tail fiber assembly protein [Enterobacter kobei]|jgi:hypothetical protein
MNKIFFSAANLSFYPEELKEEYEIGIGWPEDAIEIAYEQWEEFIGTPPADKTLGADKSGMPAWVDIPPLSHEEEVAIAESQKNLLIDQANEYINSKQWPGKAAMGRLKDAEKEQYNAWLDYLDALEAVDTSSAPDIEWPTPPEV